MNLKRWFISYLWHSSVLSRQIVPPRPLRCFFCAFFGPGKGRFPFPFRWLRVIGDEIDEEAPPEPSSSESSSSDPRSVWQNINKLVIQANPNYSGGSPIRISHRDEYPYITLLKRPIDVVWINYDSTHVLRVFTQSTWFRFQDMFQYLASGLQISSFKAMTEVKQSCFYPRSIVSTFSRLKIGAICTTRVTGFGVSLVNCALLELCSSAWYRLSSYAPYS